MPQEKIKIKGGGSVGVTISELRDLTPSSGAPRLGYSRKNRAEHCAGSCALEPGDFFPVWLNPGSCILRVQEISHEKLLRPSLKML